MYIRAIYYPDEFSLPLVILEPSIAAIEVGREVATVVMLLGVTALVSADRWEWFLTFAGFKGSSQHVLAGVRVAVR